MELSIDRLTINDFPARSHELVRFNDVDTVGHVNNIAFVNYVETGRVNLLYTGEISEFTPNANFVVVQLNLNFRGEMNWPGTVEIGSAISRIGRTSIAMVQALFQEGRCTAYADSVLVLMDRDSRKPVPIPNTAIEAFDKYMLSFEVTDLRS